MKKYSLFFAVVTMLVALASCDSSDRFDVGLYSVAVPTGFAPEEIDTSVESINSVQLTTLDDKNTVVILAFPFEGNDEIVLYNQTVGGANPALVHMTYPSGGVNKFNFGDRSGSERALSGIIEGR
ncbi:MAG: hypothetical protein K2K47_04955, partial [Duncaniella sp.]|nr:hypothetical protein [Duncaniella sp.]